MLDALLGWLVTGMVDMVVLWAAVIVVAALLYLALDRSNNR